MTAIKFDKYEAMGAYHWQECDRRSAQFNPPMVARYEVVVRRTPTGRVLDVGAGDGYLSGRLSARCREVIAIEYETLGVKLARQMLAERTNVTIHQGDVYALPFEDRSFDAVVMADVIEHLYEPELAVSEMARVIAPDGVVLVTTPHWRADRIWDKRHVKEYTADELRAVLERSFTAIDLSFYWSRFWSDLYRTRLGWRLLRLAGRLGFNPFLAESKEAKGYCQMVAVCRHPRHRTA